jgi:hypothetical protein
MPLRPRERFDFFLSRRGSVATIAQEVTDVLTEKGYQVFVQDYDIPLTANFIEEMHEGIKNARDLVVLFTRDYERRRTPGWSSRGHCSAHAALFDLLKGDNVNFRLKQLTAEGLAAIVHEPLRMAGHKDRGEQDALISQIKRDASERPHKPGAISPPFRTKRRAKPCRR